MTTNTKTRGRPKGSEKDDTQVLAAIADLILGNPNLPATTAMRRLKPKAADADIRRWQAKWKDRKASLLAAARARVDAQNRRHERCRARGRGRVDLASEGAFLDSPTFRAAQGLAFGPAMKAIEAYQNSPAMRAVREWESSPTMRVLREIENNPAIRIAREHQRLVDKLKGLGFF